MDMVILSPIEYKVFRSSISFEEKVKAQIYYDKIKKSRVKKLDI